MSDPWNLTLDSSVFDDWSGESKIIIRNNDVTEIFQLVKKLEKENVMQTGVSQIEHQLSVCFKGDVEDQDVNSILQLVTVVAQKLSLMSLPICQLTVATCKQILLQVLALENSNELQHYFNCLEFCLRHAEGIKDSISLITILEIVEQMYRILFQAKTFISISKELFKHSSGMLLAALPIIEQQHFSEDSAVTKLLTPLVAIGKFSCRMDAKSMAFIWKLVLKTIQQHPATSSELELGKIVVFLVEEIFYLFDKFHDNASNISRLIKVIGFLLKVIIGLLEKETVMLENEDENEAILKLVLQLQKFTPDAIQSHLSISGDLVGSIHQHISITTHPLLEYLTKSGRLKPSLLKASSNCTPENRLNFICLLGLLLTPGYASIMEASGSLTTCDLLSLFLASVDYAHLEFNCTILLNGIVHSGKGVHTVPVYELLVMQACSSMAIATPNSVTQCVAILLQSFIQGGFWASVMASDILTFMARYGSPTFCLELVQYLFLLSQPVPTAYSRPIYLINRLIQLLSAAGRASLLKSHPVEKYPDMWVAINWKSFSTEQKTELQNCSVPSSTGSQPVKANTILRLCSTCTSGNSSNVQGDDLLPNLLKSGTQLFNGLNNRSAKEYHLHMEHLLISVLRVLLSTAQPAQKESHLHLMQVLKLALDSKAFPPLQLDTVEFLSKIGKSGVAASPQQPAVLRVIANLFSESLASRSFFVQLCAMRAFEIFFKTTPHSHLAPSCVRDGQDFMIKQFLNRNASKSLFGESNVFLGSQIECVASPPCNLNPLPKLAIEAYALPAVESFTTTEPHLNASMAKRPRLESTEQLQFLLTSLAKVVSDMGQLRPLPTWSKEEIKERIEMLNSYI